MRVKFQIVTPQVDARRYAADVEKRLAEFAKRAARVWIDNAFVLVPVYSGMSRGSLFHINQLAGGKMSITGLRVPSRIPQGRALGKATVSARGFFVMTRVPHYAAQDTAAGPSPSSPWRSFEAGNKAALAFIRKNPLGVRVKVISKRG